MLDLLITSTYGYFTFEFVFEKRWGTVMVHWTIMDKGMDDMVALTHEQAFFWRLSERSPLLTKCAVHSIDMYCTLGQKYWAAARPLDYKWKAKSKRQAGWYVECVLLQERGLNGWDGGETSDTFNAIGRRDCTLCTFIFAIQRKKESLKGQHNFLICGFKEN